MRVETVEGQPVELVWFKATNDGTFPDEPNGFGFTFLVALNRNPTIVKYEGRYAHEIDSGVLYVDEQLFNMATSCGGGFIFKDGFDQGSMINWSQVVTH